MRTDRWRLFDLMWGLHFMDWRAREDFNHPLLVGAALLGTLAAACGIILRVLRQGTRRQPRSRPAGPAKQDAPMPAGR